MIPSLIFAVLCLLTLSIFNEFRRTGHPLDSDARSNYPTGDHVTTRAIFPDKAVHFVAWGWLTQLALLFGVPVLPALLIAVAFGYGYERIQGYVSKYDLLADALGASTASLAFVLAR